jgi:short-subunit dehydrogenase
VNDKFFNRYGPWALIAGGSEGIGFSFAEQLAARGINLILIARRTEPLNIAAEKIRANFNVQVRCEAVDLTSATVAQQIAALTQEYDIGLLIYNAGAANRVELFLDAPLQQAEALVALNCRGPLLLCHQIGTALRKRGRGGIILLSSLAGFAGGAYNAAYSATKAFDTILAESLWAEFKSYDVDVLGLVAGATNTPASANSGAQFGVYVPMSADAVAAEGLAQLGKVPVWVAGESNRATAQLLRAEARETAIDYMSAGAAALFGKPYPLKDC